MGQGYEYAWNLFDLMYFPGNDECVNHPQLWFAKLNMLAPEGYIFVIIHVDLGAMNLIKKVD